METYYVTNERNRDYITKEAYKGGAEQIQYDYSSWAEDNGTLTSVTVTVESGDATISSESLASNVKTFLLTTSQIGHSTIKLVATDGTDKDVQYLNIITRDPMNYAHDYGMCAY
jgi:hypothetical protein